MHRLILSSAVLLAMSACAPSPGVTTAGRVDADRCFRPDLVRNFTAPNDQTLYVRTADAGVFRIETPFCRDMTRALSIALEPMAGSSRLCPGDQAVLLGPATGSQPCRVRVAARLTAAEIEALPSRDRP